MLNSPKDCCATSEPCVAHPMTEEERCAREIGYLASRIEEYNRILIFRREHPDVVQLLQKYKLTITTNGY